MVKNKLKLDNIVIMAITAMGIGVLTAILCAFFNYSLTHLTKLRHSLGVYPFLLLPLAGLVIVWVYQNYGNQEERGNNLIIDEIHFPKRRLRGRLAPMIMLSSVASHFFGASVGREGVGVQIGAGIADQFKTQIIPRKLLLMMGMSAGFGSIFCAPFAGSIFGIEVFHSGELAIEGLVPCAIAAFSGFFTMKFFGLNHMQLPLFQFEFFNIGYLFLSIFLGVYFGLVSRFTNFCIHKMKQFFVFIFKNVYLRVFFGGLLLTILFLALDNDRYFGLGENIIERSFYDSILSYDSLGKILTTSISLAAGFKGGEIMPLFYIGATSANALASLIRFPILFFVPLGFISVFAGSANVPLTSLLLACEFFGPNIICYVAITILISYLFSGHVGIYQSQKKKFKLI